MGFEWRIAGTTKATAAGKQAAAMAQAEALATKDSLPGNSDKQRVKADAVQLGVDNLAAESGTF